MQVHMGLLILALFTLVIIIIICFVVISNTQTSLWIEDLMLICFFGLAFGSLILFISKVVL